MVEQAKFRVWRREAVALGYRGLGATSHAIHAAAAVGAARGAAGLVRAGGGIVAPGFISARPSVPAAAAHAAHAASAATMRHGHFHRVPSPFTEIGPGAAGGGFSSSRRARRLHGLGAITADQAAQTAMPTSAISSKAGFTQTVYDNILQSVGSGTFVGFNPGPCSGTVSAGGNIKLIQQGSGLALTGVSMGLIAAGTVTAAALAPFTLGISALIGLFPLFFSHHAAAVAKEQRTICAAVPAATNYLQQIEAAVQSGTVSPQDGIAALNSLLSDFKSQVSSIMKNSASACNAACVWVKQLTAIVAYQSSLYQDMMTSQVANPIGTALTQAEASLGISGLPSWALPAGILAALWFMTN